MLFLAGGFLLALGLFSGLVLLLAPLGVLAADPNLVLWLMFPLLCLVGFAVLGMRASAQEMRTISLAASALLLLLALASVAVIVLGAASVIVPPEDAASLWFVMGVGAVLGLLGAASFGRQPSQA
ncbi:hypothetical protein ACFPOE_08030 [Caenimonas terrae]|uniref:Uncharacterized protein n=1 Tax=Caenimonas terrae TaxID=696074 RepID=A0ABW0NCC1_9BURK